MYDAGLVRAILLQIDHALQTIQRRFIPVTSAYDFTASDAGLEKLDAICMQLIAIGESVKNLDKVTGGTLLIQYPLVAWKQVMGIRDVISHHYFELDAEVIFAVCTNHIPSMHMVVRQMLSNLDKNTTQSDKLGG